MPRVQLSPLAYAREAERLNVMARRAFATGEERAEASGARMMRQARRMASVAQALASEGQPSRV